MEPGRALALLVQGSGDDLFSRAAFSSDQNGGAGGRDLAHQFEDRFHLSGLVDQP